MMTIKADLTAITKDGLLQAELHTLHSDQGDLVREPHQPQPGDRLVVVDLFGKDRFQSVVVSIDGGNDTVFLDVDWEPEPSKVFTANVGSVSYGITFGGLSAHAEGNRMRGTAGTALPVPA